MNSKNCIICGKEAVMWTGHIHTEIGTITSGWCDKHRESNRPPSNKCTYGPGSCDGDYSLTEIELEEELTKETLLEYVESQNYLAWLNAKLSPYNTHRKRKGFWGAISNIFGCD